MSLKSKPDFTENDAAGLIGELYALSGSARVLPGERDQNFLFETGNGEKYVFKIVNREESREILEAQAELMQLLNSSACKSPRPVRSLSGQYIVETEMPDRAKYIVWMLSYIEGMPLGTIRHHSKQLLYSTGYETGRIDSLLSEYTNSLFERDFSWDLRNFRAVVEKYMPLLTDSQLVEFVRETTLQFERRVEPVAHMLRKSIIHNDANDYNIIASEDDGELMVAGIIDWGDAVYSYTIANLAVAISYAMLDKADPLAAAVNITRGYNDAFALLPVETEVLFTMARMRISVSICMAAWQQSVRPGDKYLVISQEPIARSVAIIGAIDPDLAEASFRLACAMDPNERQREVSRWLSEKGPASSPVLGMSLTGDNCVVFDLSVEGDLISGDHTLNSESFLSARIKEAMTQAGASVGMGRFDEPRILYSSPLFNNSRFSEREERTVHLGNDLFVDAGSPVYAPFDGIIHAFAYNPAPLDYGNVIMLSHKTDAGHPFYTLYGHLGGNSLEGKSKGQKVAAGEMFASVGSPGENGGWSPHLHFQVISDIERVTIDFPGVCPAGEREAWKILSPDPLPVLNIPAALFPSVPPKSKETEAVREKIIGTGLSLGYRDHIKMSRGYMQYMYDDAGLTYLDCYNNVPHVGHCHPEVLEVAISQMKKLNTNTRYLHDNLNEYAALLLSTLPAPLSRCFFVNSGSEANELALRLAFNYTGNRELVVLDGAYHGNTTTLIDISPYKHDGPGGHGTPSWVHKAPVADCYRGEFRYADPEAGSKYAGRVGEITRRLVSEGKGVAAFIAETCPSVGGQIIFPDGYLKEVYSHIRSAGGLSIADEVQTGYGRMGTSFYAFMDQGVIPDIVVLGKPIGNGHPIGAVITTDEVAAAFDNGMEFFSTFGGNTVSAAIGRRVLEITLRDKLQEHSMDTGNYLLEKLSRLKEKYSLAGDVRGSGLFFGIELVKSRETLDPAASEAAWICNRMRDNRILIGTDGPFHNVLKIRPPLAFNRNDADILADRLDRVFSEIVAR